MRELASAAQIRQCVVYVVAKAPNPGTSKTRLCPPLDSNEAAHLAGAFLLDVQESVRHAGLDARLHPRSTCVCAAAAVTHPAIIRPGDTGDRLIVRLCAP